MTDFVVSQLRKTRQRQHCCGIALGRTQINMFEAAAMARLAMVWNRIMDIGDDPA